MMLPIGELNEKARPMLVIFVFACIVIATGLLYITVKAESVGDSFATTVRYHDTVE